MHKDDARLNEPIAAAADVSRRTVTRGMAWSVPVIVGAVAAPAATGSQPPPPVPSATPQSVSITGDNNAKGAITYSAILTFNPATMVGAPLVSVTRSAVTVTGNTATAVAKEASVSATDNQFTFTFTETSGTQNLPMTKLTFMVGGVAWKTNTTVSLKKNGNVTTSSFATGS